MEAIQLVPARYVTIDLAEKLTGYTEDAIRSKIKAGYWTQGREWIRAPDGRILIDMEGYRRWAEKRSRVA